MKCHKILLFIGWLSMALDPLALANLVKRPLNMAVIVENDVILECGIDSDSSVRWYKCITDSSCVLISINQTLIHGSTARTVNGLPPTGHRQSRTRTLDVDPEMAPAPVDDRENDSRVTWSSSDINALPCSSIESHVMSRASRYSIEHPQPGQYNLRISNCSLRDGGTYQCQAGELKDAQAASAQLVVMEEPNIPEAPHLTFLVEGDDLFGLINVTFRGRWAPRVRAYVDDRELPTPREHSTCISVGYGFEWRAPSSVRDVTLRYVLAFINPQPWEQVDRNSARNVPSLTWTMTKENLQVLCRDCSAGVTSSDNGGDLAVILGASLGTLLGLSLLANILMALVICSVLPVKRKDKSRDVPAGSRKTTTSTTPMAQSSVVPSLERNLAPPVAAGSLGDMDVTRVVRPTTPPATAATLSTTGVATGTPDLAGVTGTSPIYDFPRGSKLWEPNSGRGSYPGGPSGGGDRRSAVPGPSYQQLVAGAGVVQTEYQPLDKDKFSTLSHAMHATRRQPGDTAGRVPSGFDDNGGSMRLDPRHLAGYGSRSDNPATLGGPSRDWNANRYPARDTSFQDPLSAPWSSDQYGTLESAHAYEFIDTSHP